MEFGDRHNGFASIWRCGMESWSQFHKVFALVMEANMAVHSFTVSGVQA